MWVGDTVYFLSDRDGPTTLFAYDPRTKAGAQASLDRRRGDIQSASAGPDAIVYEQLGALHLFDLAAASRAGRHPVAGDLPGVRPRSRRWRADRGRGLSPTGARAVFEARGEILTVPAEKGDIRNLTQTAGVAERDPAWSPDGKSIAYFSDESGEYELHVARPGRQGRGEEVRPRRAAVVLLHPRWSPDSKKIAYSDKRLNLWCSTSTAASPSKVDTNPYDGFRVRRRWSPDSQWLAYTQAARNHLRGRVPLLARRQRRRTQVTDGMSDAASPRLRQGGKYLYFTASTDIGPALASGMAVLNGPSRRAASTWSCCARTSVAARARKRRGEGEGERGRGRA